MSGVAPSPYLLRDLPFEVITESSFMNANIPDFPLALSERLRGSGIVPQPLETSKSRRVSCFTCCTRLTKSNSAPTTVSGVFWEIEGRLLC